MAISQLIQSFKLSATTSGAELGRKIDAVIEQALSDLRLVGAVVLVARNSELLYQRAAGMADRENGKTMQPNTLFRLSSVSKPYVSAAALSLVARGRIGLDDPVSNWLPEFQPVMPDGQVVAITVRHLLSHMAGLTYGFLEEGRGGDYRRLGVSDGMERSGLSLEENLKRLGQAPLVYEPGRNWGYSIATDVLGGVIARAHGTSLGQAVEDLVTGPLQLSDTGFAVKDPARLAAAYLNDTPVPRRMQGCETVEVFENTAGIQLEPDRALDTDAFHSGGSGMVGSAGDFLRFLEALRGGGGNLLPKSLVNEMARPQTGDLELVAWPGRAFGLGFTVLKDPAAAGTPESIGSWRLGGAYGHSWFVDPFERLTVVAFTNTAFEGMYGQFTVDLCEAVYAGLREPR
ncbi:serine hydrolase [Ciceribacter sp. RN22]|uniref:serine hydrolase domain-containing protein n=1 Tax=Ciceribacter sp. RN22 TaxID=2954932 RepID=UPI002093E3BE|nr:serine hydrolase domain-containing protein [Ciceribacter sp. RN22]MCO6179439.1 beta-lactamase family protein [Ciceribacter sp. RN22]